MARVTERIITRASDGFTVSVEDRPASIEQAERVVGRRLDRRKTYCLIEGEVCDLVVWSDCCSGCNSGGEPEYTVHEDRGSGCGECGYTGRSRRAQWVPLLPPQENNRAA